jgi:hypothetical protein
MIHEESEDSENELGFSSCPEPTHDHDRKQNPTLL